ncbi:MAG TPA: SpoIIE family protein phosphatase [Bacteroidota bacterium]|nr:SpoIIE family protein phosphatase [Bacteroidota bacterium]
MRRPPRTSSRPGAESHESRFANVALFEFSSVINSSLELPFILSHILLTIMGKTLATRGMALLGTARTQFEVAMVKGFPQELTGRLMEARTVPRSAFAVGDLDVRRHGWVKFLREQGVTFILPLVIERRTIGILGFGGRRDRQPFGARDVTYLRSLANIAASAIEKIRTIGELRKVNRQLDQKIQDLGTLFETGKEFSALLDPERQVRLLELSLLGRFMPSRYLISLRDGADMRIVASKLAGQPPQGELLAALARTSAPVRVQEIVVSGTVDTREPLRALGMSVVVPIRLQGETRGLILLGGKMSGEDFSQADMEFLSSIGNLAIISLENARLFKEAIEKQKLEDELMIAREIQKGLLPSVLPEIPGFQLSAANISSKQVGGDYYDVLTPAGGRFIIAIGDVSGKGSPAALLMANLQATIRALVPLGAGLGDLTGRVNDLMCENTGGNKFVTFFWGEIDPAARTLTYVNAGHNYPYLYHGDGTFNRLDRGGMILGILKTAAPYEEATVALRDGDALVLFTDGVSEAMSTRAEEYGEERLERVLSRTQGSPAGDILDAIHRDVLLHASGAQQSDDITMMVVKVL